MTTGAPFTMRADAGFTLIELMTAVTLFGILIVMAIPMYGGFIANTHVRTATESMLAGVRLAQTEAVKRNGQVEFVLDESAPRWTVNLVEGKLATPITTTDFKAGASKAKITPSGVPRRVTFNGLGRICCGTPPKNPVDDTVPLRQVDVTSTTYSGARNLRLLVGGGGDAYAIKACDPQLPKTDPAGCP